MTTYLPGQNDAGNQRTGQELYERQQALRAQPPAAAPAIVAVELGSAANIGGVLRLADAAGSRQVVFIGAAAVARERIRKVARHADRHLDWSIRTLAEFLADGALPEPLIALETTDRATNIFATALPAAWTIVVGNERHGIPAALLARCAQAVQIPMYGVNGSMNVTHALGIALFEWRRRAEVLRREAGGAEAGGGVM